MKKIPAYILFLGIALMSSLSSCLKDDSQPDFTKNQAFVELPVGSSSGNGSANTIPALFTIYETPADYFIYVNYAAPEANPNDVNVTLSVKADEVSKYNTANGKDYTLLPAEGYTLSSTKITIPAGQRKVKFPMKINTDVLDPTKTYALPLTITDASGVNISGNFGTLISVITLRNRWDGVYTMKGILNETGNGSVTGAYPRTMHLITTGKFTVAAFDPGLNSYTHAFNNVGKLTSYEKFSPIFTVDVSNSHVTSAVNYYGQPSSNNNSARLDASGSNAFTMTTDGRTPVELKIKYILTQSGTDKTFFDETWTYTEAR